MILFQSLLSKTALIFVITVGIVTYIILQVDWEELKQSFALFNLVYIFPALLIYLCSFIFRALRWKVFLSNIKNISFSLNFEVVLIGWAANNLLPARLGELVRAYVMGKQAQISRSASLATILVERIFDGLLLLLCLLIIMNYYDFPDWVRHLSFVGLVIFGGIFIIFFLLQKCRAAFINSMSKLFGRISPRIEKIVSEFSGKFIKGLECLSNPGKQAIVIIYTIAVWICEAGTFYVVLRGFQIDIPLSGMLFTLIIINFGILIPSSPGYIGTFQFFAILALSLFHVSTGSALSFAVVVHAVQYIPVTLLGLFMMNRLGLHWSEIKHAK